MIEHDGIGSRNIGSRNIEVFRADSSTISRSLGIVPMTVRSIERLVIVPTKEFWHQEVITGSREKIEYVVLAARRYVLRSNGGLSPDIRRGR